MKRIAMAFIVALAVVPLVSCNNDDNNNDEGILNAVFAAANPNPGPKTISLQPFQTNGAIFTVKVNVTQFTDLYGVSYTLTYSPSVLKLLDATPVDPNFLNQDGVATSFQATLENGSEGRLVVGHTRLGNVSGVSGSGTLHTLTFQGIAQGTTGIGFESVRLVDSAGAVIPGVVASGGTATVTSQ